MAAHKQTLLKLPVAIFRIIFDLLERKEIGTFRLVSRYCRYLSEPIFFRTITLHDSAGVSHEINENILDRLRSPKDDLSHHVRHLKIGPFTQDALVPSGLESVLNSLQHLLVFSWNVRIPIEFNVLDILHKRWPDVRLHVTNHYREHRYTPLDTKLLSSPQLHSLSLTVCRQWTEVGHESEFPTLRDCLFHARNLKDLHLEIDGNHPPHSSWLTGPANLQFTSADKDRFPALRSLKLPYDRYELTAAHCSHWLNAMDWTALRRLHLGRGAPRYLFSALTGRVPQLQALHFGFGPDYQVKPTWDCPDLGIVLGFLGSIEGLEELEVESFKEGEWKEIEDAVYAQHGPSLRVLRVGYYSFEARGWKQEKVRKMVESCPEIRELGVKLWMGQKIGRPGVEVAEEEWSYAWPSEALAELKPLAHLESLDIHLFIIPPTRALPELPSEFIIKGSNEQHLREEAARKRPAELFDYLQALHYVRVKYQIPVPKEWVVTVKRISGVGRELEFETDFSKGGNIGDTSSFDPFS